MKGILFTEPNRIATVEELKTNTRRMINPQPDTIRNIAKRLFDKEPEGIYRKEYETIAPVYSFPMCKGKFIDPRFKVGEKVYIKEPYKIINKNCSQILIEYLNDSTNVIPIQDNEWIEKRLKEQSKSKSGFCNKMFMPEWCARNFIEITDVRCECLQDISDDDCLAEGIIEERPEFYDLDPAGHKPAYGYPEMITGTSVYATKWFDTPQQAYAAEIDLINGKGTWNSNPFVWSYYYKLVK